MDSLEMRSRDAGRERQSLIGRSGDRVIGKPNNLTADERGSSGSTWIKSALQCATFFRSDAGRERQSLIGRSGDRVIGKPKNLTADERGSSGSTWIKSALQCATFFSIRRSGTSHMIATMT